MTWFLSCEQIQVFIFFAIIHSRKIQINIAGLADAIYFCIFTLNVLIRQGNK